MEMARKIFLKCSRNIVYGLFGVIVLYLFLLSLFGTCAMAYTDEHIFFIRDFPLAMLTGLMFLAVFMAWGQGEVNRRTFYLISDNTFNFFTLLFWNTFLPIL